MYSHARPSREDFQKLPSPDSLISNTFKILYRSVDGTRLWVTKSSPPRGLRKYTIALYTKAYNKRAARALLLSMNTAPLTNRSKLPWLTYLEQECTTVCERELERSSRTAGNIYGRSQESSSRHYCIILLLVQKCEEHTPPLSTWGTLRTDRRLYNFLSS